MASSALPLSTSIRAIEGSPSLLPGAANCLCFVENRGSGAPPGKVGVIGDVFWDTASFIFYVRRKSGWVAWNRDPTKPRPLAIHPSYTDRYLWISNKCAGLGYFAPDYLKRELQIDTNLPRALDDTDKKILRGFLDPPGNGPSPSPRDNSRDTTALAPVQGSTPNRNKRKRDSVDGAQLARPVKRSPWRSATAGSAPAIGEKPEKRVLGEPSNQPPVVEKANAQTGVAESVQRAKRSWAGPATADSAPTVKEQKEKKVGEQLGHPPAVEKSNTRTGQLDAPGLTMQSKTETVTVEPARTQDVMYRPNEHSTSLMDIQPALGAFVAMVNRAVAAEKQIKFNAVKEVMEVRNKNHQLNCDNDQLKKDIVDLQYRLSQTDSELNDEKIKSRKLQQEKQRLKDAANAKAKQTETIRAAHETESSALKSQIEELRTELCGVKKEAEMAAAAAVERQKDLTDFLSINNYIAFAAGQGSSAPA
ncbi:hypothetical protein C8R44DRAFT_879923 [Mycena epipterygia]|nr:hypothetical protein C8R44DRAFT_879923 [Mycena epipterygia]